MLTNLDFCDKIQAKKQMIGEFRWNQKEKGLKELQRIELIR